MKKFIFYILTLFVPIFSVMIIINYVVDPGHIYSNNNIDKVIEGVRRGLCVTNVTNMDERALKRKLAELYKGKSFDYLVIGSSRVMTISEDCLKSSKMLNLGVSGSKLEDMIAFVQICEENNIKYKNIIVGTDPTLFNANYEDNRWKSIGRYYNTFIGYNEHIDTEEDYKETLLLNLVSPSYFQSAINDIPNYLTGKTTAKYVKTYVNEGATKRPDGSIYYAKNYRENPQTWVDNDAVTHSHGCFNKFYSFSTERASLFRKLIDFVRSKDVNVIIWCCPYHPIFFQRILRMKGIQPSISYIHKYAKDNGIKIIGSFDPVDLNLTNKDFYDAFHLRKEVVDRLIIEQL